MKDLLTRFVDVREEEMARVSVMAGYIFFVIASYHILKPMTRSLFVSNLGLNQLPFLYILLAVAMGLFVVVYLRLAARARLDRLINVTNLVLMVNLLGFRWLLKLEISSPWLYYVLFTWASIYGVLTTTQFWLLANYLFNAREAKRVFPLLTVFAILGGIAGGYLTKLFVDRVGDTADLALLGVGFLVPMIVLMNLAWRRRDQSLEHRPRAHAREEHRLRTIPEVLSLVRKSRHLALLVGIVFVTYLVVQIADFQFVAFASEVNTETDALTGFLGFWLSTMSATALFFQLFFAGYIIRRFGVQATTLFLPVVLFVCSAWVFLSYGLSSILALKLGDGAFRHSINKVGTELLFLPLPTDVKRKTKAFVDMFADRFARGMAGVVLLVFYSWLGFTVPQISLICIGLTLVWLGLTRASYREYVNSFRQALQKRRLDADELIGGSIKDEETINSLILSLGSRNERQVIYGLRMLQSVEGVELAPPALPLLQHPSPEVRRLALQLLRKHGDMAHWPQIEPLLHDPDVEVRREAVRFYATVAKERVPETLAKWLQDQDPALRGAALYCVAENPKMARKLLTSELIYTLAADDRDVRVQLADALGLIGRREFLDVLTKLLEDPDPDVRAHAMLSAGRTHARRFLPRLVESLTDRACRQAARSALADYGDEAIEPLVRYLRDPNAPFKIRVEIPRVLGMIGGQRVVDLLLDNLNQSDEALRFQVIKALNKLRARFPELHFDHRVDRALGEELKKYLRILAVLHVSSSENGECSRLLRRVLREKLDDHIDRIFRLLGLRYPPRDIYNAYAATVSSNRSIRANAVEFLDNILSSNLKRVLLPIVEELPADQVLQRADGLLETQITDRKQALQNLVDDRDPWIRACAIFEIGDCGLAPEFREQLERARQDGHSLVRETADFVLRKMN